MGSSPQMPSNSTNTQQIYISEGTEDAGLTPRKASRIELRTLRDAYRLRTADTPIPDIHHEETVTNLRRMTAYCTAESYDLKRLFTLLRRREDIPVKRIYYGECLCAKYTENEEDCYLYFMNYGVTVLWGFKNGIAEGEILRFISSAQINPYSEKEVECENFMYGIAKNSQICNDRIYLTDDTDTFVKMVISIAVAQSVKLDYFEELVFNTIEAVKDYPDEVEKEGKVKKKRKDILKIMGRLYKLSFDLYLITNVMAEPEFVWEYSSYSPIYETCVRYMDIKVRADNLTKRIDIIHGILEILGENITTHNSEKLEKTMTWLIGISAVFGFLQVAMLVLMIALGQWKK